MQPETTTGSRSDALEGSGEPGATPPEFADPSKTGAFLLNNAHDHHFVDARSDPAAMLPWAPAGCTCGWRSTPKLYTFLEDVEGAWRAHVES
jgi:hypothetical protein